MLKNLLDKHVFLLVVLYELFLYAKTFIGIINYHFISGFEKGIEQKDKRGDIMHHIFLTQCNVCLLILN